ncbi:hypothetical protein SDC9_182103 [bioreactor metagenome]|uniref:Uncharacterized protein n=1 Tax=bioreactor metagenome TaxID=1076179 RepID=A0A645H932_9ZZZZ
MLPQQRQGFVSGKIGAATPVANVSQGHFFDKGNVDASLHGVAHQVGKLVVVDPAHHHRVELDPGNAGGQGGVDAA